VGNNSVADNTGLYIFIRLAVIAFEHEKCRKIPSHRLLSWNFTYSWSCCSRWAFWHNI